MAEVPHKDEVRDGIEKQYSKNGKIIIEISFKKWNRRWSFKQYYENGVTRDRSLL